MSARAAAEGTSAGPRLPDLSNPGDLASLGNLLQAVVERSHQKLLHLSTALAGQPEPLRRQELLKYLHFYRQQLLRLTTLVSWLRKHPDSANAVARARLALDTTSRHQAIFQETADKLFFLWRDELEVVRAPIYDIPTALEVFTTGNHNLLPTCVEELRGVGEPDPEEQQAAVRRMDMLLRCCVLDSGLPEGLELVGTEGGVMTLRAKGQYEVGLTLVPEPTEESAETAAVGAEVAALLTGAAEAMETDTAWAKRDGQAEDKTERGGEAGDEGGEEEGEEEEDDARWRWCLADIKLLPGSRRICQLTAPQDAQLRQLLQERMWSAAAQKDSTAAAATEGQNHKELLYLAPLRLMHLLLSDMAARLLVDSLVTTARSLGETGQGWEGQLRIEPLPKAQAGFQITYWPECPVMAIFGQGALTEEALKKNPPPSVKVELGEGRVTAVHSPPLGNPLTGLPVLLDLEPLYADAERVVLSAANANAWIQLDALAKEINKHETSTAMRMSSGSARLVSASSEVSRAPLDEGIEDARLGHRDLPCVELAASGVPLLVVQMQLRTGKLKLLAGSGLGCEGGMDIAMALRQEESRLQKCQANPLEALRSHTAQQRSSATGVTVTPLTNAAGVIAERLVTFFQRLALRDFLTQLMVASRPLQLQYMPSIPRHIFDACLSGAEKGGTPGNFLAFPPVPLPRGFPLHKIAPPDAALTRTASQLLNLQGSPQLGMAVGAPASLRFHLGIDNLHGVQAVTSTGGPEGTRSQPSPRYSLFMSSATNRGLSLKALRRVNVPVSSSKAEKSSPLTPDASGKRKRSEDGGQEMAVVVKPENGLQDGARAGGSGWGRSMIEDLAAAVFWSQHQIVWEHLQAQLDALGVTYTEEVDLGSERSTMVSAFGRRINVLGLDPSRAAPMSARVVLKLTGQVEVQSGGWAALLLGPYMAGFPENSTGPNTKALLLPASDDPKAEQSPEGFVFSYSLASGHSMVDTLTDIERALRCCSSVCRLSSILKPKADSSLVSREGLVRSSTVPHGGEKAMELAVAPLPAGVPQPAKDSTKGPSSAGDLQLTAAGLMGCEVTWTHQHSREATQGAHEGLTVRFRWRSTSHKHQQVDAAAGQENSVREFLMPELTCSVTSTPPVVPGSLDALGQMVLDGEEGLALDALRCIARPLLLLNHALQHQRLAAAGLRSFDVVPQATSSPYSVYLLLASKSNQQHRVHLRFFAQEIVRLSLSPTPGTVEGGLLTAIPNTDNLVQKLKTLPSARTPQDGPTLKAVSIAGSPERPEAWLPCELLCPALALVFQHVQGAAI